MAVLFLTFGIILLITSVSLSSQTIAFVGLGLTFWGTFFLLVAPEKQVEGSFLVISTLPAYMTIDRMLKDFKPKNEVYCIPSYTRAIDLPEYIKGLKQTVTFIPEENATGMAAIEDIAKGKLQIRNPKGFLVTPPGLYILDIIEQNSHTDLTKIPFYELVEKLPDWFDGLYLAKEIKLYTNENYITIEINDSLFKNLYSQKYNLQSVNLVGCPLVSAAACAIAKSTGKPIIIQEIKTTPDGKITTAILKFVQS